MADALDDGATSDEDNEEAKTKSSSFLTSNDSQLDLKLNALEAAATTETQKLVAGIVYPSEEAGSEADALEAFVGIKAKLGESCAGALGDEEERLIQMVRIQVPKTTWMPLVNGRRWCLEGARTITILVDLKCTKSMYGW